MHRFAADADQPGLEIGAPVERVQRLEDLEEDVLRQVLGLVVLAGELVGDVEDLPPVLADDLFPRLLIAAKAALDQRVDRISGDRRADQACRSEARTRFVRLECASSIPPGAQRFGHR